MGNLALKCENEWQARKVDVRCPGGPPLDVRVMRTDGAEAEEFDRPVVTAHVMYRFPDYVVVQWFPMRNTKLGKRGQLRVLQRHEVLTPGQLYFLFPIPIEVSKNIADGKHRRSRRIQSSKNRLSLLLKRAEMGAEGSMQSQCEGKSSENGNSDLEGTATCPGLGWTRGGCKSELLSALGVAQDEGTLRNEGSSGDPELRAYFHPSGTSSGWRPALVSIPESPVGFHSRTGSPMTPIAFRLVSLREGHSFDGDEQPVLL